MDDGDSVVLVHTKAKEGTLPALINRRLHEVTQKDIQLRAHTASDPPGRVAGVAAQCVESAMRAAGRVATMPSERKHILGWGWEAALCTS